MLKTIDLIVYLGGCFVTIWIGAPIIAFILKRFNLKGIEGGFRNAGRLIGQMERFLIFASLFAHSYAMVGIVLTIKAIYRFGDIQGDIDQKMKLSEYFIIGTFASLIWTLLVFGLCKFLIEFIN